HQARRDLQKIRRVGVRVALDDFGTGYSPLTYLIRFPVDELKIDKSFIDVLGGDKRVRHLLKGVIDVATALDVDVVAEGIDSQSKLAAVRRLGCGFGQGYLFARPAPLAELYAQ